MEQKPEPAVEKVPSSHTSHEVLVPSPNFPAWHGAQTLFDVVVHSEEMKEPTPQTSQVEHDDWPGDAWKVFVGHSEHASLEPVLYLRRK